MNRAWGLPVIAICVAVASPAVARETPATGCSDATRGCTAPAAAAKPRSNAKSNADKLLYAILLGCLLVTGNQASRRKAARVVFS